MKNSILILLSFLYFNCNAQLRQSIYQTNYFESNVLESQPLVTWEGANDGNYQSLTNLNQIFSDIWIPTQSNVATYNHHPFIIEFNDVIHVVFSTHNQDEEGPGEYMRYSKSLDNGQNWTTPVTIFESQDNINNSYLTDGGRVIVCAGFAIVDNELYGIADVNDRSSLNEQNPRVREGVGLLARKINSNGTFETVYWVENSNGSFTSPTSLTGFPIYSFNTELRSKIRDYYFNNPNKRPDWYFSVPLSDLLFSQLFNFNGDQRLVEPVIVKNKFDQFIRYWRVAGDDSSFVAIQTSLYSYYWENPYLSPIPNSPSRLAVTNLYDNNICLVGNNQGAVRDPLYAAFSTDGFSFLNNNIYNVDSGTQPIVFSGYGKGTGLQYPNMIELKNGKIAIVYSVNKENIKFASFDKPIIN